MSAQAEAARTLADAVIHYAQDEHYEFDTRPLWELAQDVLAALSAPALDAPTDDLVAKLAAANEAVQFCHDHHGDAPTVYRDSAGTEQALTFEVAPAAPGAEREKLEYDDPTVVAAASALCAETDYSSAYCQKLAYIALAAAALLRGKGARDAATDVREAHDNQDRYEGDE